MTNSESGFGGTPVFDTTRQHHDDAVDEASTTDIAKDEAGRVAESAIDAGRDVAAVANDEAHDVAHETKKQAKDLYRQTQQELREQAAVQQQRVADGLRSIGDELMQMSRSSDQQGVASDLVGQAANRTQSVARWLDERDPGSLLREVKSYARRNPGTFITVAALTGVVAGRLTRALASGHDSGSSGSGSSNATPATGSASVGETALGDTTLRGPAAAGYSAGGPL